MTKIPIRMGNESGEHFKQTLTSRLYPASQSLHKIPVAPFTDG